MMRVALLCCVLILSCAQSAAADVEAVRAEGAQALAESRFDDAAASYAAVLEALPDDGEAHYRLGMALMSLERLDEAAEHFLAAEGQNYQPLGVSYRMARIDARQGREDEALTRLESIADAGFPAVNLIESEADFQSLTTQVRFQAVLDTMRGNRYPCKDSEAHRAFDFWVGDWDVTSLGTPAGRNEVTLILGDCVVFENWTSVTGGTGKSFNYYDAAEDHWRQIWVSDNGSVTEYTGQFEDGVLHYKAKTRNPSDGSEVLHKLIFTPNEDGSVRQLWEQSADDGETWQAVFDGHYVRRVETAD